jgi:NAD(P)-dependent dehydrogenase (short-subunit alcohol dehydrogenase family)
LINELDFTGKTVLVAGGSSGIGNGMAQAFRQRGAQVHVWGTRASAADYAGDEGCDLEGLGYSQVDVSDAAAIAAAPVPFEKLDVLIHSQGAVLYRRQEFEAEGWNKVMAVNLEPLPRSLGRSKRDHHRCQFNRRVQGDLRQSSLCGVEGRRCQSGPRAGDRLGRRRHPRQRHRPQSGRYQDDQGHHGQ